MAVTVDLVQPDLPEGDEAMEQRSSQGKAGMGARGRVRCSRIPIQDPLSVVDKCLSTSVIVACVPWESEYRCICATGNADGDCCQKPGNCCFVTQVASPFRKSIKAKDKASRIHKKRSIRNSRMNARSEHYDCLLTELCGERLRFRILKVELRRL